MHNELVYILAAVLSIGASIVTIYAFFTRD